MSASKRASSGRKARGKVKARMDPHRDRESSRYESPIASREHILDVLRDEKGPMDFEALAELLGLTGNPDGMEGLRRRVIAMQRDGQLIQNRKRGLVPVDADALIAGRVSAHPDGFGFLITDDDDKDIYLNGKQMRQVLHGDHAVVCITGTDRRGRREGRIVDVVERANHMLVGRLIIEHGVVFVSPDSKRIHLDLMITPDELNGAEHGDMVVAEITDQPTRRQPPVGRIAEVLGQHLRPGMEIDVALHSHGIPTEWPDAVTEQANAFSATVPESAAAGRKDVRDLCLVTIDGADARDFDDAVWCEKLDKGWRLLVAIADVAHYVEPGSSLDAEAVERGTSVYFPGRVVPMLPEALSNGLCSLNPDVDRLCMLCELTLDSKAKVKKVKFHNGILRSHARLTYSQVHEMLTDSGSKLRKKYAAVLPMIEELHHLYKALAKARKKRGAIEFESNETRILFDDDKKIQEIVPVTRNDAHKLIEECMILANIQAAAWLEKHEVPALYRVHAGPKADRLEDLRAFLALRSLSLGGGDTPSALDYAALSAKLEGRPDRSVIQTVMLRSMQQAVYQPGNEGHFGLALEQYAHFTSPIRRYPDLLVHRALKFSLKHGKPGKYTYSMANMQALGESCSTTERRAEEASRDVVSWLKCEYMLEHVGSEFPGVISSVTSFGLFVDLTGIHIEGLIHITNLSRDYYRFEQAAHALIGERTGRQYHLGEPIVVRVEAVNLDERKIDFSEVSHEPTHGKAGRKAGNGSTRKVGKAGKEQSESSTKRKRKNRKDAVIASQSDQRGSNTGDNKAKGNAVKRKTQPASSGGQGKPVNPEHRRQQKRKAKQLKRDDKRAAARRQKQAEKTQPTVENNTGKAVAGQVDSGSVSRKKRAGKLSSKKVAAKKRRTARTPASKTLVASKAGIVGVDNKPAGRKVAGKKTVSKKPASKKSTTRKTVGKKTAGKSANGRNTGSGLSVNKKTASKKAASKKIANKQTARKKVTRKKRSGKNPVNDQD
ncbi:MAG: ribonuclease R [Granulosicoccus sp.]